MSVNPLQPRIQGLTYPLTLSNGGLAVSADVDLVREHVLSVVETRWYERVSQSTNFRLKGVNAHLRYRLAISKLIFIIRERFSSFPIFVVATR